MPKGRKPIEIDIVKLQEVINQVEEGESPPKNRTELWKLVSEKFEPKMSAQTLMNKAEKNECTIRTPKARRGNISLVPSSSPKGRKPKKFLKQFEGQVHEQFGQLGTKTIKRLLEGNVKAAIKAFCWDCVGQSKKEVSLCQAYTCPLWPHRPWTRQQKEKKTSLSLPVIQKIEDAECGATPPSSAVDNDSKAIVVVDTKNALSMKETVNEN